MKEIDNIIDFEGWIKNIDGPVVIQALDIRKFEQELLQNNFEDSMFLGCKMSNLSAGHIVQTGGLVISNRKGMLFQIHRAQLYSPKELFLGFEIDNELGYKATFDYKVYQQYVSEGMESPKCMDVSIARRLHDHSITDALEEAIAGRKVVAIMGGHAMERSDSFYLKIARISRQLTKKGYLMVSGGGPGAMEATHLGAYFAYRSESELEVAIQDFSKRPAEAIKGKEYDDKDWLQRAWNVMEKYPIPADKIKESMSIGIPTWLYGHEPPAVFATHIAKYFANSVREDGLLTIAKYGVIFAPGSAGTTQEIFQDATQNHYAAYNNSTVKRYVSPMILFGIDAWTKDRPLWDFMQLTAKGRPYGEILSLTEDEDKVIDTIVAYDPEQYAFPQTKS